MYDCLEDKFHRARFDNLYMAAKFGLNSFWHEKKVMVEGVCRTGARGIPSGVLQAEVTGKDRINAVKGTVKAALLENCAPLETCPLVAVSVYDTKPVHFCLCVARNSNGLKRHVRFGTAPPAAAGLGASYACVSTNHTTLAWETLTSPTS